MAIDITLTSVLYNPWSGSGGEALTASNTLEVSYASLGFVASTSDSYKSTAGDIFKVFIDGTRIYRTADSLYAGGKNFLETGDVDNSILNGETSQTWSGSTSNTVWTIDTANQKIILDKTAIAATSLYGSGGGAAVTFSAFTDPPTQQSEAVRIYAASGHEHDGISGGAYIDTTANSQVSFNFPAGVTGYFIIDGIHGVICYFLI